MIKIFRSIVGLFLIIAFSNSSIFAKSSSSRNELESGLSDPPIFFSALYLCQNKPIIPLMAAESRDETLNWHRILSGGVALLTAPISVGTAVESGTESGTKTISGVQSSSVTAIRSGVVSNSNLNTAVFKCDPSKILPADRTSSVYFSWEDSAMPSSTLYYYSYTTSSGSSSAGTTAVPFLQIFGLSPGESATLTVTAASEVSPPPQTITCSVPCVTYTTPNFSILSFCAGTSAPILMPTSPNGITGTWSPAIISSITSGSYIFTPDPLLFPCALTQTVVVTVDPLLVATAAVQPTCALPTGTIVATAPIGVNFQYSTDGVTYQSSPIFTGLVPNTYNVSVRNTTTGCVSAAIPITINPTPSNPILVATAAVQPTCALPTGTIVATAPIGVNFQYSTDGVTYQSSPIFTGLVPNTYNVSVRNTTTGCVSAAIPITVNPTPSNPILVATAAVQPTCALPTGTIVATAPIGVNFQYSTDGVTYQSSPIFTGLVPNTYNVSVRNTTTGCVSAAIPITINPTPSNPILVATAAVQPTCALPTGTIVATAPIGVNFQYSTDGVTYQSSPIFTGLVPNTYNVSVRNTTTGCVSAAIPITVNPTPSNPILVATAAVQPTCALPTGTIVATAPIGVNFQYSTDGVTYQSSPIFTGLVPNTYNVSVRNTTTGCVSAAIPITVNPTPSNPILVATAAVQPTCALPTGTIVATAPIGVNFQYSTDGVTYQSSPIFTGLVPSTYNVSVRNTTTGCVSAAIPITVNPTPSNPILVATAAVQPTCALPTGTIVATAPIGVNFQYSTDGVTYQSSPIFTGLVPNTYNVLVRNTTTGCVSAAIPITINVSVYPANTLVNISWTVSDAFSKNQIITVTATAAGNYLYQLDSGPFQTSAIFEDVAFGLHSITVIDRDGCSTPITDNNVLVIGYPKYFTPNGDGYNDIWNIPALSDQLNARIYIFDRYGKQLKEIRPKDSGWDGTYVGQLMPADDYWFTIEYVEKSSIKKFKAHFSLKR